MPNVNTPGAQVTPIPQPGLMARVAQATRYVIAGVSPSSWMSPGQPLKPMAPSDVAGRNWDYPVGVNLQSGPRAYEPTSFDDLRALADNCDILRLVLETRKDQMESLDWMIRVKPQGKKLTAATRTQQKQIDEITAFFHSPNKRQTFAQWQRQLLEDMFVIDGATLYKRLDRKGRLYSLEVMDGATIKLLVDEYGRPPDPPSPCFQQILKGVPAVDYTAEEMLYLVRNPRSHKLYGYSPVEQIIITINILIRRALFQLDYYRDGSQPDAFGTLPTGWTQKQIKDFQDYFDSFLSGNSAERRKLRFMPDGFKYQESKQPPLKDLYDEFLARIICFAFSIAPEPFVPQVNRATAETSHDRSLREGLETTKKWMKSVLDNIIFSEWGALDIEFAWDESSEQDPKVAAEIRREDTKAGLISIDEARDDMGKEELGGAYSEPMPLTGSGYTAIVEPDVQREQADATHEASIESIKNPKPAFGEPDGKTKGNEPAAAEPKKGKEKAAEKIYSGPLGKAVRRHPPVTFRPESHAHSDGEAE